MHHTVTASTLFDLHISSTQSPRTLTGSSLLKYLSNDSRLNSKLVYIPYLRVFRRIHHCFAQVGPSPFGHSLLVRPGLFNDLFTLSLTFVTSKLDLTNVSCSSVKNCFFAFRQSTKSPRQTLHCLFQRKLARSPLPPSPRRYPSSKLSDHLTSAPWIRWRLSSALRECSLLETA